MCSFNGTSVELQDGKPVQQQTTATTIFEKEQCLENDTCCKYRCNSDLFIADK